MFIRLNKYKIPVKYLFLIDAVGAFLSVIFLGFVLVRFESTFGVQSQTLYVLASVPAFFILYDIYSYLTYNVHTAIKLKQIAIFNFLYCCLSILLLTFHDDSIKPIGWTYFGSEILIVLSLAVIEFNISKHIIKMN